MYLVPKSRGRQLSYYLVTGAQPNPFGANPFTGNYAAPTLSGLGSTRASRRALQRVFSIQRRARRLNGLGSPNVYSSPADTAQPTFPITRSPGNLLTSAKPSSGPLDYVSPQHAISAGQSPKVVCAAWAKALAAFSTQNEAVTSGVPAGVVTNLWPASRRYRRRRGLGDYVTSPDGSIVQDTETGGIIDTTTGAAYNADGQLITPGLAPSSGGGSSPRPPAATTTQYSTPAPYVFPPTAAPQQ